MSDNDEEKTAPPCFSTTDMTGATLMVGVRVTRPGAAYGPAPDQKYPDVRGRVERLYLGKLGRLYADVRCDHTMGLRTVLAEDCLVRPPNTAEKRLAEAKRTGRRLR